MLKTRVVTALLLFAGFLAVLYLLPFSGWLLFASLIAGLGGWEWAGLMKRGHPGRLGYAIASAALSASLGSYIFDIASGGIKHEQLLWAAFGLAVFFWLVVVPFWLWAKWETGALFPGMVAGLIVLVPACLAMMQLRALHPTLLLAWMAAVWIADIAAYFCGRTFGRHKLAPVISPGKTWEGAIGGGVGVVAYGFVVAAIAGIFSNESISFYLFACLLFVLTAVSVLGDLFESLAKRQADVKDSGTILPGHGGILDRIDSLTSTLPMVGLVMLAWDGRIL
ncbi:MAG: phosphatidate cytidylyltransferase [Nitrospira sp.]|nr:phosphatidate cytidylyltransferase [Nitrospira sp.]